MRATPPLMCPRTTHTSRHVFVLLCRRRCLRCLPCASWCRRWWCLLFLPDPSPPFFPSAASLDALPPSLFSPPSPVSPSLPEPLELPLPSPSAAAAAADPDASAAATGDARAAAPCGDAPAAAAPPPPPPRPPAPPSVRNAGAVGETARDDSESTIGGGSAATAADRSRVTAGDRDTSSGARPAAFLIRSASRPEVVSRSSRQTPQFPARAALRGHGTRACSFTLYGYVAEAT